MLYSCFESIAVLGKSFVKNVSQSRNYEDGFLFTNYIDTKNVKKPDGVIAWSDFIVRAMQ